MKTIFFYGLFMDRDLLVNSGYRASEATLAYVRGHQLRIGNRATLVPHESAIAYGTLMQLPEHDLIRLYSGDGVEDYQPEKVQANILVEGSKERTIEAFTYLLPEAMLTGSNSEYAAKLVEVAAKVHLPKMYIEEIKNWI